ncbi:MAG: DedA family protein [Rhodospirillaceae bacterium]|nr:DedA family protein [Rhodospirillaceae bacterium]MBL6940818.1 DedA family protein [Rhodospirillales bacterium]
MESLSGVFMSAFLAATILPFSSEIVLTAFYAAGSGEAVTLWLVASAGNVLGALVNWWLGRYLLHWQDRKWFPFKPDQLGRAENWFGRFGQWSLLLAWVPLVGDPLTFVAGLLRVNVWVFLVLVTIGKAGRYAAVLWLADGIIQA